MHTSYTNVVQKKFTQMNRDKPNMQYFVVSIQDKDWVGDQESRQNSGYVSNIRRGG